MGDDDAIEVASPHPPFACWICRDTFTRKEHLDRHTRRHLCQKPFHCHSCEKQFSRRDSLLRHATVHGGEEAKALASSKIPLQRNRRACIECAKAKQRCQDGVPCSRCRRRHKSCHFLSQSTESSALVDSSLSSRNRSTSGEQHRGMAEHSASSLDDTDANTHPSCYAGKADTTQFIQQLPPTPLLDNPLQESVSTLSEDDLTAQFNDDTPSSGGDLILGQNPSTDHGIGIFEPEKIAWSYPDIFNKDYAPNWTPNQLGAIIDMWAADEIIFDESLANVGNPLLATVPASAIPVGGLPNNMHEIEEHANLSHTAVAAMYSNQFETCSLLYDRGLDDNTLAEAEDFGHISPDLSASYATIQSLLNQQELSQGHQFPSLLILRAFCELYFEHFDSQFPFMHPSSLETSKSDWISVLAMAVVGAEYSTISKRDSYRSALFELLQKAITINAPRPAQEVDVNFAKAVLLRDISRSFCGLRSTQMQQQYDRNMLPTICKTFTAHRKDNDGMWKDVSADLDVRWQTWIAAESKTRLLHCVYRLECFNLIFFELKPLISLDELTNKEVAPDPLWKCRSAREWHALISPDPTRRVQSNSSPQRSNHQSAATQYLSQNSAGNSSNDRVRDPPFTSDEFRASMHHLLLYTETRTTLERLSLPPLWQRHSTQSYPAAVGSINSRETGSEAQSSGHTLSPPQLAIIVERELEPYMPVSTRALLEAHAGPLTTDPLPHLLLLLSHVPLRKLFCFSGWQADQADTENAREDIRAWMRVKQSAARTCLWHAARIFHVLGSKQHFACYDALCLLISALFIWAYDTLGSSDHTQPFSLPTEQQHPEKTILRLDRTVSISTLIAWINEEQNGRIHITGIGTLNGKESVSRLLSATHDTLRSRRGWWSMRIGICYCLKLNNKGFRPSYMAE